MEHNEREFKGRIAEHRASFPNFWDDHRATPAAIVAAMGNQAVRYLFDAGESVWHIMALACGPGIEHMTEEERLAMLHQYLKPHEYQPRLPLVPNPDGTVTVISVQGLDAWGLPIPDPEPDFEDIADGP